MSGSTDVDFDIATISPIERTRSSTPFRSVQSKGITFFHFYLIAMISFIRFPVSSSLTIGNKLFPSTSKPICIPHTRSTILTTARHFSKRYQTPSGEVGEDSLNKVVSTKKKSLKERQRTGWIHNQPTTNKTSKTKASTSDPMQKDSARTGWLHNTSSKSKSKDSGKDHNSGKNGSKKEESMAQFLLRKEKEKVKLDHRIITPPVMHPCGDGRIVAVTEHRISVPLVHDFVNIGNSENDKESSRVDLFFSVIDLVTPEIEPAFSRLKMISSSTLPTTDNGKKNNLQRRVNIKRAQEYVRTLAMPDANKMLLYLQGGPGFGSPRSISMGKESSWLGEALSSDFTRIVLMDQRGTGSSSRITKQTLRRQFPDLFLLDDKLKKDLDNDHDGGNENERTNIARRVKDATSKAVDYLSRFRADSIVQDAEMVREALITSIGKDESEISRPWGGALGQSFGGFCIMTYLSIIPNPPKVCLFTGGIAPISFTSTKVYEKLWERVKERNLRYYDLYPNDVRIVKRIVRKLLEYPTVLPSGGVLTARRFLQLGIALGSTPSSFVTLHSLFSTAFVLEEEDDEDDDCTDKVETHDNTELSKSFLKTVDGCQPFDDAPIYYLLHESIYCDGKGDKKNDKLPNSSGWTAEKVLQDRIYREGSKETENISSSGCDFDYNHTSKLAQYDDSQPTLLYGEMVFPWMADGDYAELSGFGMRSLSHALAEKNDWGPLYDRQRMREVLSSSFGCKAAAVVYYDDMYVDFDASMECCKHGGALEACKVWVTNEYQHSGISSDGARIFRRLLGMAKGSENIPS